MITSQTKWAWDVRARAKQIQDQRKADLQARKATEPPPTPDISLTDYIRQAWAILEPKVAYKHNWHIDAMCEHLEAVSRGEIQYLVINIPPRHMKPVEETTLVMMADGSRKQLKDVIAGDRVISHMGRACRVDAVHVQGELPVLRIETHGGRIVRAAPDHPFLTPSGWVQAQDLASGDVLAVVVPETEGRSPHGFEAFRLAGYYIGDGNTSPAGPTSCQSTITCFDDEQTRDIVHCATTLGFTARRAKGGKGRYNISSGARDWLRETGMARKTSWTKRVPAFVFEGDAEQIGHFLGAYFACDGTLNQKGHARKDMAITYHSVNRPLLEDVQHLLLRLGVRSRIREHVAHDNTFTGGRYVSFRLEVSSQDDTARFISRVPVIGEKAKRLEAWGIRRTQFDYHLQPDPIVSIAADGTASCRCLTVTGDHSFLANDIAVHNSLTVCVFWPTWEWTWWPESRWLTSSYGGGLATRDALKSRRLIQSPWYQRNWGDVFHLTGDQNQKTRYENSKTGYRIATTVGGAGTGEGGDRIIVDDPIKEVDAYSDARREAVNDWWDGTMSTRANDPETAAWVVICQRLHERDLPGYIMEKMGRGEEDYELLIIPAEHEETDRITSLGWQDPRKKPGELLWPERFDREWMERQKQKLGSRKAAAQLQQRPAPAEGAIFKKSWWRFWKPAGLELPPIRIRLENGVQFEPVISDLPDSLDESLQSWDMAFKDLKKNDYVCGQVWGRKSADRFLLDQVRDHLDIVSTLNKLRGLTANWPRALAKLVEDKANGPAVVQLLRHEIPGLIEVTPEGGKVSRANAIAPTVESGNVYLPHPHIAPWVWEYIDEFTAFPAGANDDMVDTTSQALTYWLPKADEKPAAAAARVLTAGDIGF